jgi:hypothetical protein
VSVNAHRLPDVPACGARPAGGCLLGNRYRNDGAPLVRLNALQAEIKAQIDRKVNEGIYTFEAVPCCICNGADFDELAQKDRYGL